ncbi:MAG: hypothetical protein RL607_1094 [Bacteroidota bacterium]
MKNLILSLCACVSLSALAQKNIDPTPEDISKAKSLREQYSKDDVAILESTDAIGFDYNSSADKITVSIKTNEHLMNINHRADIHKYEFYDSESSIENFIVRFRNEKNTSFYVKDEPYKDDDLFYNDARVKYTSIDFPVQGYTYFYELNKKYNDIKYCTTFYFQDEFPVLKKKIVFSVPKWLDIELKEFNFNGFDIKKTVTDSDSETIYTFTLDNAPAYFKEKDSPGRTYLYPHIMILTKSYAKGSKSGTLFKTHEDLYKWYISLVKMMHNEPEKLREKVTELTAKAKTDEEKIKNIYYWVQDNIRYIAFEDGLAGFKPDEAQNVFEKRYGDCKGMANLIKQMLVLAGFDARLTWIGTKHIAYDYKTPSLAVDNHMICTLFFKGKHYFLDGTEKFCAFGEYAERIQNKEVMIEDGEKCILDKIPAGTAAMNKEVFTANLSLENEQLKGTCQRSFIGESREYFQNIYNHFESNKKKEMLDGYLAHQNKSIKVDQVKTSDINNREQKLTIDYAIDIANKVSSFDNEIYVDLDFMNEYKEFQLKDRKTDYEFDYKTVYESDITLQLPAGYKVTKLPESISVKENNYEVSLTYTVENNKIHYKKSFLFKNAVLKTADFEQWRAVNKRVAEAYNTQIILTK